ncbi:hypothetical protein RBSWK_02661 [Rhodopirellula baltica SWK14]|uniref:Uncharacterized protein n=1 Tax=Rhodopirellula baltica SWK14 TaxID=993516 RepID=L7CK13_RHOBT|nr:hypothetical protein RBSWK_02661 [Rhodopirellula baltica SWK14]
MSRSETVRASVSQSARSVARGRREGVSGKVRGLRWNKRIVQWAAPGNLTTTSSRLIPEMSHWGIFLESQMFEASNNRFAP